MERSLLSQSVQLVEGKTSLTLHLCEPLWLAVMLGGTGHCVEEHQQKHQPVEVSGLDGHAAVLPHCVVQLAQLVAAGEQKRHVHRA